MNTATRGGTAQSGGPDSWLTCRKCGAPIDADANPGSYCLACMLEPGLSEEGSAAAARRYGHFELLTDEDGEPLELGRGAMGVTYKAFDIDLCYPVALKVISESCLGDENARLRFLREARMAASIRHPNVASAFHLGRIGDEYFYAMEFVEGETLESLIERSGILEPIQTLQIANQVAAGLAAVHGKNLVHRDIKPSNIMLGRGADGDITVKIIDLGLAKSANESNADFSRAFSGSFSGTPAFASPEQLTGLAVDIRSDLYSLGVTIWKMLTGKLPFSGTVEEAMARHLRATLPVEQLAGVPQPVIVLTETLLQKDPGDRMQTPSELLKAIPVVIRAVDAGATITRKSLQLTSGGDGSNFVREPEGQVIPRKISLARLPVTGGDLFGREEDIAFLNQAWERSDINVATIVAWAGAGKSTLVSHWLRTMAADQYRRAELVYAWSFYVQSGNRCAPSADEFFNAALIWFGDPDPASGTAWEKGERLANLVAHRRTVLILDGLEPLQNPPGSQEGRVRDPALQAFLRELAVFNKGLCIITTRIPVADLLRYERTSAPRHDLEQLTCNAGAKLLLASGVTGPETELQAASTELNGHCLTLALLGSYLTDAYQGDIRFRKQVSERLVRDAREGIHARKVLQSYEDWLGNGPALAVLRMLGLFDRPAEENVFRVLMKPPAIPGLTDSLSGLTPSDWKSLVSRLRRAKLLTAEDERNPFQLDTHPLIREYFAEQLRTGYSEAWQTCNARLYDYYRTLGARLPSNLAEMEPLFSAVICGCQAGLYRSALHEVYIPRIQRGNERFAANVLGARGALLSVLAHFFDDGRWGSIGLTSDGDQRLTEEDQLCVLLQAGEYLTAIRGHSSLEARTCYERVEALCQTLDRPRELFTALLGQWHNALLTERLSSTMQIARRLYLLAGEQNDASQMVAACRALAGTSHFMGDFDSARTYAKSGMEFWRSQKTDEDLDASAVVCLCYKSLSDWHFGDISSARATMTEAMALANDLKDTHALAGALHFAAILAQLDRNPSEVQLLVSDLAELSTRYNFTLWLAAGQILDGWARGVSGNLAGGLGSIEEGIRDYRAAGSMLRMPFYLALKAEVLYLANRISEALSAIEEADALVTRFEERGSNAELRRLRAIFLSTFGAGKVEVERSFAEALGVAKEQKSFSLEKRVEASIRQYRLQI